MKQEMFRKYVWRQARVVDKLLLSQGVSQGEIERGREGEIRGTIFYNSPTAQGKRPENYETAFMGKPYLWIWPQIFQDRCESRRRVRKSQKISWLSDFFEEKRSISRGRSTFEGAAQHSAPLCRFS